MVFNFDIISEQDFSTASNRNYGFQIEPFAKAWLYL